MRPLGHHDSQNDTNNQNQSQVATLAVLSYSSKLDFREFPCDVALNKCLVVVQGCGTYLGVSFIQTSK